MKIPALTLLITITALFISCSFQETPGAVVLEQGQVTITREMGEDFSLMELTGEAGFYWDQFIDPMNPPPMTEYTELSRNWRGDYPQQGNVSLRFIINKEPLVDLLALSFGSVWSSYRLYVNGRLVEESGNPSLDPGRQRLYVNRLDRVFIDDSSNQMDVVVHISNPYYHRNGMRDVRIGTRLAISESIRYDLFWDCMILGILLAMSLYHLIMAKSKTERSYILLFALLTLTVTFRFFVSGSRLVFDVFPQLNMITYDRLQRLGIYPIAGFFMTYLQRLYPKIGSKIITRIVQVGSVIFSIVSFFVSPQLISGALFTAFYPFFILTILSGVYIIVVALIKREEDAFLMAAGVLVLIGTAIFDMVLDRDLLTVYRSYQMGQGMIVFIFIQAYILSLRLNRAYENEKHFREALQGVQSRLELTVEGAQLGLVEWDIVHNTWFINDFFAQMIDFEKDHHIFSRRDWLAQIHPDDVKEIDALLKGALSGKIGNFRKEYRLRMGGGSYRWCLLLGKVIQQNRLGGAEWFVGLHLDVSEKKRSLNGTEESLYPS
jgi:PAS domain-containing protein